MPFAAGFKTFPVLTTDRLRLRRLESDDAERYWELASTLPEACWDAYDRRSVETAEAMIRFRNNAFKKKTCIRWGIVSRGDEHLVGMCELHDFRHQGCAAAGYWLAPPLWGRGIMGEALHAVLSFAFDAMNLHRIEAWTAADNARSIRMLEKTGFQREGTLRRHIRRGDTWTDTAVLARVS